MSTIPDLFLSSVDEDTEKVLYYARNDSSAWQPFTRGYGIQQVAGLARRLYSFGVTTGSRVAIISNTRREWAEIDLAILALGAVVIGLYPTATPTDLASQLRHSKASVLIVENDQQYERIVEEVDEIYDLIHIFSIESSEELLPLTAAEADADFLRSQAAKIQPDDLATIIYTSGTTGKSKGVMLSHRNFVSNLYATKELAPIGIGQRAIVCLPLAHSLQRFAMYRGLLEDIAGYCCPLTEFQQALPQVQPTILLAVPRMLEKIKASAELKAAERGWLAKTIFAWAMRQNNRQSKRYKVAKKLVHTKILQALGGELKVVYSGGAPLSPEIANWFTTLGIEVYEGWGLSETCAPATVNPMGNSRLGSVGKPLPNTELKIASDGEILVRGEGVFSGYLDDPSATKAAFTADGFFQTGDLGRIDPDGFVWITGRKKDLIVTAGGKNIAPAKIEQAIVGGFIEHVVVAGDNKPFVAALIALEEEALSEWAAQHNLSGEFADWVTHPAVRKQVAKRVEQGNTNLARYEQVKKYTVLRYPLTIARGDVTPTLKLRRGFILSKHQELVDMLFVS